jgi:hypothetical protein
MTSSNRTFHRDDSPAPARRTVPDGVAVVTALTFRGHEPTSNARSFPWNAGAGIRALAVAAWTPMQPATLQPEAVSPATFRPEPAGNRMRTINPT